MRSYLDILTELKDTIMSDAIPFSDRIKVMELITELFNLLWRYSD